MSFTESPHPEYQRWAGQRIAALLSPGETLVAWARIARSPGLEDQSHSRLDEFNPFAGMSKLRPSDAVIGTLLTGDLPNDGQQDAVERGKSLRRWGRTLSGGQGSAAFALLTALRQHTAGQRLWGAVTPRRLLVTVERPPDDRSEYAEAGLMLAKTPLNLLAKLRGGPTVAERLAQRQLRRLAQTTMVGVHQYPRTQIAAQPLPPDPELRRILLWFADGSALVVAVGGGQPGAALVAALA